MRSHFEAPPSTRASDNGVRYHEIKLRTAPLVSQARRTKRSLFHTRAQATKELSTLSKKAAKASDDNGRSMALIFYGCVYCTGTGIRVRVLAPYICMGPITHAHRLLSGAQKTVVYYDYSFAACFYIAESAGLELFRGGPVFDGHILSTWEANRIEAGTIVALPIKELIDFWHLFADFRLDTGLVALYFARNKKMNAIPYSGKLLREKTFTNR